MGCDLLDPRRVVRRMLQTRRHWIVFRTLVGGGMRQPWDSLFVPRGLIPPIRFKKLHSLKMCSISALLGMQLMALNSSWIALLILLLVVVSTLLVCVDFAT